MLSVFKNCGRRWKLWWGEEETAFGRWQKAGSRSIPSLRSVTQGRLSPPICGSVRNDIIFATTVFRTNYPCHTNASKTRFESKFRRR
jgi:hypothetical protein